MESNPGEPIPYIYMYTCTYALNNVACVCSLNITVNRLSHLSSPKKLLGPTQRRACLSEPWRFDQINHPLNNTHRVFLNLAFPRDVLPARRHESRKAASPRGAPPNSLQLGGCAPKHVPLGAAPPNACSGFTS